MARYDYRTVRLFVDAALSAGAVVPLDKSQSNYLCNVMRLSAGDPVQVFNGREGEWRAVLDSGSKKSAALTLAEQTRPQEKATDLHYLFAPLKHARLDYMVQKAVELGVSRLCPVMTRHTQAARVNLERMQANAVEAAEQCGVLAIPDVAPPQSLSAALQAMEPERVLIFCDEGAELHDPVAALRAGHKSGQPLAVLIGPEGGFADEERAALVKHEGVVRLSLGPRILRADTAAVAALTLVQAVLGDWR